MHVMTKTTEFDAKNAHKDLMPCLSAAEVGRRLREANDALGYHKRVLAFYLLEMEERRLFEMTGHGNTAHFAATQLDMDERRTREFINVGRSLWSLQKLDQAFREGRISWTRVLLLLRVVEAHTQTEWIEFAENASCKELRNEVYSCERGCLPGEGDDYGLKGPRTNFEASLTSDGVHWVEQARMLLSGDRPISDADLLVELAKRAVLGATPENGDRSPQPEPAETPDHEPDDEPVPEDTRSEVLNRDGHACRNCGTHYSLHIHHIRLRSEGGKHDIHNLLTLCKTCHRSAHRDLLLLSGHDANQGLTFTSAGGAAIDRRDRVHTLSSS